jgi:trigger factor
MKITHNVQKHANSTADIVVTIGEKEFETLRSDAVKKIVSLAEVDGFRKGHAPESVVLEKFGEMAVFEEMANTAIDTTFVEAIKDSQLDAIGTPSINVTKLAPGNDFEYTIQVSILPKLELPDYVKLAKGVQTEKEDVSDKDIESVVLELRRMRAHKDLHADGSEHDHADENHAKEHSDVDAKTEEDLPELDDEYVKTLGDFETVADLKNKIKENLTLEKSQKNLEKRRNAILEAIEKDTKGVIPDVLIDSETERMLAQMKGDVAQMGGTFEEYLKYIKKTEGDLKQEWRTDGEKRAKIQLILNQIAKEKNIEPDKERLEQETKRLMEMYKEADKERAEDYMYQMLLNEAVLTTLEA